LKPAADGSPVVGYFGPGGTSFRVLRQPEAATTVPNIIASVPPARFRLSRSIDMTSSFLGARRPSASRRRIPKIRVRPNIHPAAVRRAAVEAAVPGQPIENDRISARTW
jgi:hypothetical protein